MAAQLLILRHDQWRKGQGGAPASVAGESDANAYAGLDLNLITFASGSFSGSRFSATTFHDAKWSGCQFNGCSFSTCDFLSIHITGCSFTTCRRDCHVDLAAHWQRVEHFIDNPIHGAAPALPRESTSQ